MDDARTLQTLRVKFPWIPASLGLAQVREILGDPRPLGPEELVREKNSPVWLGLYSAWARSVPGGDAAWEMLLRYHRDPDFKSLRRRTRATFGTDPQDYRAALTVLQESYPDFYQSVGQLKDLVRMSPAARALKGAKAAARLVATEASAEQRQPVTPAPPPTQRQEPVASAKPAGQRQAPAPAFDYLSWYRESEQHVVSQRNGAVYDRSDWNRSIRGLSWESPPTLEDRVRLDDWGWQVSVTLTATVAGESVPLDDVPLEVRWDSQGPWAYLGPDWFTYISWHYAHAVLQRVADSVRVGGIVYQGRPEFDLEELLRLDGLAPLPPDDAEWGWSFEAPVRLESWPESRLVRMAIRGDTTGAWVLDIPEAE